MFSCVWPRTHELTELAFSMYMVSLYKVREPPSSTCSLHSFLAHIPKYLPSFLLIKQVKLHPALCMNNGTTLWTATPIKHCKFVLSAAAHLSPEQICARRMLNIPCFRVGIPPPQQWNCPQNVSLYVWTSGPLRFVTILWLGCELQRPFPVPSLSMSRDICNLCVVFAYLGTVSIVLSLSPRFHLGDSSVLFIPAPLFFGVVHLSAMP